MEKLKLTEKQKYCLLQDACCEIVSLGRPFHYFISPFDCDDIKFNVGAFSRKNGCRIEVVYRINSCSVRLLWHYVKRSLFGGVAEDYVFIPKAITIDREFKNSILISILPDLDGGCRYFYQSNLSIFDLCEGDTGEGVADVLDGVCLAEADDNTASDVNPHAVLSYHSEDENEHSVNL